MAGRLTTSARSSTTSGTPRIAGAKSASRRNQSEIQGDIDSLPIIHSVILNRSTTYDQKASKAFGAMFDEIKKRTEKLREADPSRFVGAEATFKDVPDTHSVAIVCSHLGKPLYSISPGNYPVHSENPAVGKIPLERYQKAISELMEEIQ